MTLVEWITLGALGVLVAPLFAYLFLLLVVAPVTYGLQAVRRPGDFWDRVGGGYLLLAGLAIATLVVLLLISTVGGPWT